MQFEKVLFKLPNPYRPTSMSALPMAVHKRAMHRPNRTVRSFNTMLRQI